MNELDVDSIKMKFYQDVTTTKYNALNSIAARYKNSKNMKYQDNILRNKFAEFSREKRKQDQLTNNTKIDTNRFNKHMIRQQEVKLCLFDIEKRIPERLLSKNENEKSTVQIVNLKRSETFEGGTYF